MTDRVSFLGYILHVEDDGSGKVREPDDHSSAIQYVGSGWSAFFFKNKKRLQLNLGGSIRSNPSRRVYLNVYFDCILDNGVWTPNKVRNDVTPSAWVIPNDGTIPSIPIDLRLGCLDFATAGPHGVGVRNGKIVVQGSTAEGDAAPHTWKVDPASPLALTEWSIPLDFAEGVAQIDRGALGLTASAVQQTTGGPVRCFPRKQVSRGLVKISLGNPAGDLSAIFDAAEAKGLPLHVDMLDRSKPFGAANPLVAALSIDSYALKLGLRRVNPNDTVAMAITALAKSTNVSLTTHFLSDRSNIASVWHTPGAISLGVRAGNGSRPGSLFVISPSLALDPVNSPEQFVHGVARDAEFVLQGAANLVLDTTSEPKPAGAAGFDDKIVREITYPYLSLANRRPLSSEPIKVMHAGRSTLPGSNGGTSGSIEQVKLSGTKLALPIYDPVRLKQTDATAAVKHAKFMDSLLAGSTYALITTTHDSGRSKEPPLGGSQMKLATLFASTGVATYQDHIVVYKLGDRFSVTCLDKGKDHVPIDGSVTFTHNFANFLGNDTSPFAILGLISRPVSGILKLSRERTLSKILAENGLSVQNLPAEIAEDKQWIGLLIFDLEVAANEHGELRPLLGTTRLMMPYLAVTAKDAAGQYDYSGELSFSQSGAIPAPDDEANFRIEKIQAAWRSSTLQTLDINSKLSIAGFLGLRLPQLLSIDVNGRYDRSSKTVRFATRFDPINLLPSTVQQAPVQKIEVNSLDMVFGNGSPAIVMGGSVTPGTFALGSFSLNASAGAPVDFSGLAFRLPVAGLSIVQITIDYPALRLNLDNLSFGWGGFQIALTGITMPTAGDAIWDLPKLISGSNATPPNAKTAAVTLSISLMKLPALAAKSVDRLTFNLVIGMLPNGGNWSSDFWARISAVDFSGLDLDLLRFLTFRIKHLEMGQSGNTTKFTASGVDVEILNEKILSLAVTIFHNRHASGFYAFVAPTGTGSWFEVRWLLAGHNIALLDNDTLVVKLITIDRKDDVEQLGKDIAAVEAAGGLVPVGEGNRRWLFGAGIRVAQGFLTGRAVFQDEGFCGVALSSDLLKEWFNLDFSIGVAYRRGARPEQDRFFVAITVPQVTLPAFSFMGGVISLDIAMNGDFKLDVGFPSLGSDGVVRAWDRCFGAVVGIFQGSGGFYLTKGTYRSSTANSLTLGGGYAVQAGFGASFGAGIFSVVVTIGIYAIVEGNFVIERDKLVQFVLVGAIGVVFRGIGELNWWIISVTVSIVVAAEARTTIGWTTSDLQGVSNPLPNAAPAGHTDVNFDFTVYASVSAQACIGGRWFHLCKSISVSVPMRVSYRVRLQ